MDDVIYCEVYEGNTGSEVFEGFLERATAVLWQIS
jgi:hypothetical protein